MPLEPLRHRARDLGFHLCLDRWLVDTWCTRVHFSMDEPPFPYSVGSATLTVPGHESLPLIRVDPDEEPSAGWMIFGPLPSSAQEAVIEVTRLMVPPEGARPDVYHNPFLDPLEPEGRAALAEALEALHESNKGLKYDLPPGWECTGHWTFPLPVPPRTRQGRQPVGILMEVGHYAVHVPWIDRGESGTLVALDFIPQPWLAWGTGWRARAEDQVGSFPDEVPARPTFKVGLEVDGVVPEVVRSGPYGVLRVRHYLELAPVPDGAALRVLVQEAHGVPLPQPLEHGFDPHTFEEHATFGFSLDAVGLEGEVDFTLTGVYDDGTAMIVSYAIDTRSAGVSGAWPQQATLIDSEGTEFLCQGDGAHWIGSDEPLRGLLFGAPPGIGPVLLRIGALDLVFSAPPAAPLEVAYMNPSTGGPSSP